jgi:hypothetical protein
MTPRHATYVAQGVIPGVLLAFDTEYAIDATSLRIHLRKVAATPLIQRTIKTHSIGVGSWTFDESRDDYSQDEIVGGMDHREAGSSIAS